MTEKTVEIKECTHCTREFPITDKDLEFYDKISPTFSTSPPRRGDKGG